MISGNSSRERRKGLRFSLRWPAHKATGTFICESESLADICQEAMGFVVRNPDDRFVIEDNDPNGESVEIRCVRKAVPPIQGPLPSIPAKSVNVEREALSEEALAEAKVK